MLSFHIPIEEKLKEKKVNDHEEKATMNFPQPWPYKIKHTKERREGNSKAYEGIFQQAKQPPWQGWWHQ